MSSTPNLQSGPETAPTAISRSSLVDRAKALAPSLRERSAETNQLRRLPDATWKDLVGTGIVRGVPRYFYPYRAAPGVTAPTSFPLFHVEKGGSLRRLRRRPGD